MRVRIYKRGGLWHVRVTYCGRVIARVFCPTWEHARTAAQRALVAAGT